MKFQNIKYQIFFRIFILAFSLAVNCNYLIAQRSVEYSTITTDYDHVEKFSKLNLVGHDAVVDSQRFPVKDFSMRNLKLRAAYLDIPASTFKLKPFPENSAEQTQAELAFLLELQNKRTPEIIAMTDSMAKVYYSPFVLNLFDADFERNASSPFFIGRNLGKWFNYKNLPETSRVLQNIYQDATYYFFCLKANFMRPRPCQLNKEIKNLEMLSHGSYPSGHASASYVNAFVLSEILPELKEIFLTNAYDMAFSREIRGVHYPSDSQAGKEFARPFVNLLFKNEAFKSDFAKMKNELLKKKLANGN